MQEQRMFQCETLNAPMASILVPKLHGASSVWTHFGLNQNKVVSQYLFIAACFLSMAL